MTPIKVGIIGLRAVEQDGYTPGTWGVQHLKALAASPAYEVVAVCNSTVESARESIKVHRLQNAKAYGTPEDIASDPNVDLVVVSVGCDQHVALMEPALRHKKHVYVEFPVAPTASEVGDLAALADANGVKVIVGAQARSDPAFRKVQALIRDGEIGDVVSSSMMGHIPIVTADGWPHAQKDFLRLEPSISRVKGVFGHMLDVYTQVVGDFKEVQSILKVQDKTAKTLDENNAVVNPAYPVTAPDTVYVQGILENGAVASINIRSVRSTVDDTGFRWLISGTKGEMDIVTKPGLFQALFPGTEIRVRKWGSEVQGIEYERYAPHVEDLPWQAASLARCWEAFSKGEQDGYPSIQDSVKTHELLEKVIKGAIWAP